MKKVISIAFCIAMLALSASCAGGSAKEVDLQKVMTEITASVTLPTNDMMTLTDVSKLMDYYGISADDVESFAVQMNSSGVEQDEIVMIKGKDSAAAERIREALQRRLDSKANQMKNYLPEQYDIIEDCEVDVEGNYVTLFISEFDDEMDNIFESHLK